MERYIYTKHAAKFGAIDWRDNLCDFCFNEGKKMTLRELINENDTGVVENGFFIDEYHMDIIYFDELDEHIVDLDQEIKTSGITGGAVVTIDGKDYYIFEPFKI